MELNKYKLGECLELQRGYDLTSSQMQGGKVAVVGSNGIIGYHNSERGNSPCITVGRSGSVGKVHYYEQPTWAHNTTLFLKDFKGNNPKYLYYLLKNLHLDNTFEKGSSVIPSLDRNLVHSLVVPFHKDINDQRKIVTVLSAIDRKIELNRQINDNLEEQLRLITSRYIFGSPYLKKKRIGEIATIKAGGDCPITFSKTRTQECNIPIFSNGTEDRGLYGFTNKANIEGHSITVAARGTIGYCERRLMPFVPIIRLLAITPKEDGAYIYLHQVIRGMKFKKNGSVQQQLTVPEISFIEIPYPHSSVLHEYNNVANPIVEMIERNINENEILTKQRDELLPLLMNGQATINYHLSDD